MAWALRSSEKIFGSKREVALNGVAFARGQGRPVRSGAAREDAHAGILAVFRDVVIGFELLFLTAELRGGPGAEIVRKRQKDFRPERLEQGAPGFTRQGRPQRTDALGGNDRRYIWLGARGRRTFRRRSGRFLRPWRRPGIRHRGRTLHANAGRSARSIRGIRFSTDRWKSCLSKVPMALANPGLAETGKLRAQTVPVSIRVAERR